MSERGMKKWRPYKSLPEYEDFLCNMLSELKKVDKPLLSEDQKEEINSVMLNLCKGEKVSLSYYKDGFILTAEGILTALEAEEGYLKIDESLTIDFDNLLSLSDDN